MNFEIKPVPFSGPFDTLFFRVPIKGEEFQPTPHVEETMHRRNCAFGQHFGEETCQKFGKLQESNYCKFYQQIALFVCMLRKKMLQKLLKFHKIATTISYNLIRNCTFGRYVGEENGTKVSKISENRSNLIFPKLIKKLSSQSARRRRK